jgi:5-methyltetrahydropteroyltriglutamate--homocysteine methyltransferase
MTMTRKSLLTTVVGSYPQPEWLIDREGLASASVPRIRVSGLWRIPAEHLEAAQDDATLVAIRDLERAGVDIITDGEIRRESYSNRFATALAGVDKLLQSFCYGARGCRYQPAWPDHRQ